MDFPLPIRDPNSRKGQNGRVLVIGGNEHFVGAPILAARGAERSGTDLIYLSLPEKNEMFLQGTSFNFILYPLKGNNFREEDIERSLELSQKVNTVLIGNGIGKLNASKKALLEFLGKVQSAHVVIDADGLIPEILSVENKSDWILTPHAGEFKRVFNLEATEENIKSMAAKHKCTIIVTGPKDFIADKNGNFYVNTTGTPQMTIGGTGDALAGIISGFVSQNMTPFQAVKSAAYWWGKCGEHLAAERFGFSTQEMLEAFPLVVGKSTV